MRFFFWRKKNKKKKSTIAAKRSRIVFLPSKKRSRRKAWWTRFAVSKRSLATGVSGVLVFLLLLYTAQVSGLNSDLYPTSCEGTWQHDSHASGEPQLEEGAGADLFTRENSAFFSGGDQYIICRGFDRGEVNDTTKISAVKVRFSLAVKTNADVMITEEPIAPADGAPVDVVPAGEGTEVAPPVEGGQASNETDIELVTDPAEIQNLLDAESSAQSSGGAPESGVGDATGVPSSADLTPSSNNAAPDSGADSQSTPSSNDSGSDPSSDSGSGSDSSSGDSGASSWLFIRQAYAQESDSSSVSGAAQDELVTQVDTNKIQGEISDTGSAQPTPEATQNDEPSAAASPSELATISYSFDGVTWYQLAGITHENWGDALFDLPLSDSKESINASPTPTSEVSSSGSEDEPYVHGPAIANWQDIEALQFKIEGSVFSLENVPVIYLDGIHLHIEYEEGADEILTQGEVDALPHFEVPAVEIFGETKKDFQADEEPSFEIALKTLESGVYAPMPPEGESVAVPVKEEAAPADSATGDETVPSEETSSDAKLPVSAPGAVIDAGDIEPATPIEEHSAPVEEPAASGLIPSWFSARTARAQTPPPQIVRLKVLQAEVYGSDGGLTQIEPLISAADDTFIINIPKPIGFFRPGTYQLKVAILSDERVFTTTQSFTWGALVLNTDQTLYVSGDRAYVQMATLDDSGHALCDAQLLLEIENPAGEVTSYQVSDGDIAKSGMCKPDSVTSEPDYFMHYLVRDVGTYTLRLTNQTTGSVVSDTINVTRELPVEVERVSATRIYPFEAYEMSIRVRASEDIVGVLYERVPSNFTISETFGEVSLKGDAYTIAFGLNLAKGETQTFRYSYNVPGVSPRSYEIGPLKFEFSTKNEAEDAVTAALDAAEGDPTSNVMPPAENGDEVVPLSRGLEEGRRWKLIADASDIASIQIMDPLQLRLLQERLEREMGVPVVLSQQPQFGDWTVFRMEKDGQVDIFLKNEVTGEVRAITDTPEPESEAVISGDFVGWVGLRLIDGVSQGEVFVYSLFDGATTRVTSDVFIDQLPQFAGSILIWQKVDIDGRSHSFRYDVFRKTASQIGEEPFAYVHVQLPQVPTESAGSGLGVPQE